MILSAYTPLAEDVSFGDYVRTLLPGRLPGRVHFKKRRSITVRRIQRPRTNDQRSSTRCGQTSSRNKRTRTYEHTRLYYCPKLFGRVCAHPVHGLVNTYKSRGAPVTAPHGDNCGVSLPRGKTPPCDTHSRVNRSTAVHAVTRCASAKTVRVTRSDRTQ